MMKTEYHPNKPYRFGQRNGIVATYREQNVVKVLLDHGLS